MRHLLSLNDLTREDFHRILERGAAHRGNRRLSPDALQHKNIALLFEKSSTRTRLSFQVAVTDLGGNVISIESGGLQTQRGEPVEDTAEVFSRYLDGVMIRARSHKTLEIMAEKGRIPVINGLSDLFHPCQALADYMTIQQYGFPFDHKLNIAFIGEGNNVFNSLALGASFTDSVIRIASPEGYEVSSEMVSLLAKKGVDLKVFRDPYEAVEGAHVIYTDVWISMGQEAEAEERREIFSPYSISADLLKKAAPGHIVMHCLPAHRGEEITSEVMHDYHSSIFDQAENRLHVQKAVLEWVFEKL